MRIGVLSDTHDRVPTVRAALARFTQLGLDTVLHAGDVVAPFTAKVLAEFEGTLHIIYGNNDGERPGLQQILKQIQDGPLLLELAGQRVLLHHALEWCRQADIARADIIVSGHSHEAHCERRDGRLFLNPGECCGWITGRATTAIIDLAKREVEWIELPT